MFVLLRNTSHPPVVTFDFQTRSTHHKSGNILFLSSKLSRQFETKIYYAVAGSCLFRNFERQWFMSSFEQSSHSHIRQAHTFEKYCKFPCDDNSMILGLISCQFNASPSITHTPMLIWNLQTYTWTVLLALICSWWRRSHCWRCWYCKNKGESICYPSVDRK